MSGLAHMGWDLIGRWGRWKVAAAATAVLVVASIVGVATAARPGGSASIAPAGPAIIHSAAAGTGLFRDVAPTTVPTSVNDTPVGGEAGGAASAGGGGATADVAAGVPAPVPPPNGGTGQVRTLVAPKVVENAAVSLTVGHGALNGIVDQLTALATADGGIVSHADQSTASDGAPNASMTLRIPDAQFASALARIKSAGKVTGIQTSGDDVTSQYVDLQSRIHALQASRDQYLQILSKASAIGDVLDVQNQLDAVQSQLEQLQGQLNVLDDQTTYSTIQIAIVEALPPGQVNPTPTPASGLAKAWHRAAAAFTGGFDWLVGASGALGFALLLMAGLALLGWGAWSGIKRWRRGGGVAGAAA